MNRIPRFAVHLSRRWHRLWGCREVGRSGWLRQWCLFVGPIQLYYYRSEPNE